MDARHGQRYSLHQLYNTVIIMHTYIVSSLYNINERLSDNWWSHSTTGIKNSKLAWYIA